MTEVLSGLAPLPGKSTLAINLQKCPELHTFGEVTTVFLESQVCVHRFQPGGNMPGELMKVDVRSPWHQH